MAISARPASHRRIAHDRRSGRLSLALVLGVSLALSSAALGLAGAPTAPTARTASTSDASAHDEGVAAAVLQAVSGDGSGSAPGASSAPGPSAAPGSGATPTAPGDTRNPIPTPTPSPSPMPTMTPPPRAATVDARVPATVLSSLGTVSGDKPLPYYDGCHVPTGGTMPSKACLYGNLSSHTTIAIYGDSHALAWFPAILRVVQDRGWRLLEVTMSACIPADVTPYSPGSGVMTACLNFRKAAIAKLTKYHPTVILVTGTRGFQTIDSSGHVLTGAARTNAWMSGMKRTLAKLIPITSRVVMMADTPNSRIAVPTSCIRANPLHEIACATPVTRAINYAWLNAEYHVALAKHVAFIDPERWVCPTSPCPLVRGNFVVYRNAGHITAKYAATMWRKAEAAIDRVRSGSGVIIGP